MVSGCLYSIGVGPGDPELMTLKAVHTISKCPVLVLPAESRQKCVAYQIARQILPEIDEKEAVCLVMPMTKNKEKLEDADCLSIERILKENVSGTHCGKEELCRWSDPTQAENPAQQDSFFMRSHHLHKANRLYGSGRRNCTGGFCNFRIRCSEGH